MLHVHVAVCICSEVNGHLDAEKQRRRMDSLQRGR